MFVDYLDGIVYWWVFLFCVYMYVYWEDVYFFLGGIYDGKDKKDNFIMYRYKVFFFKGGK